MTETLVNRYLSESTQREVSNKYQHDRVKMGFFKNLCVLVLWTKVALALAVAKRMKLTQRDTCKLCEADLPEDRVHFFTVCKAMADLREKYIPKILNLIPNTESPRIERDHQLLSAIILDSSHPEVSSSLDPSPEVTIELEDIIRSYFFALHLRRSRLYKDMIAN